MASYSVAREIIRLQQQIDVLHEKQKKLLESPEFLALIEVSDLAKQNEIVGEAVAAVMKKTRAKQKEEQAGRGSAEAGEAGSAAGATEKPAKAAKGSPLAGAASATNKKAVAKTAAAKNGAEPVEASTPPPATENKSPLAGRKVKMKYANPANKAEQWSGRGIAPKWAEKLKAAGKLSSALIK